MRSGNRREVVEFEATKRRVNIAAVHDTVHKVDVTELTRQFRCRRAGVELGRHVTLTNATVANDGDLVGERKRFVLIVSDENCCSARFH